MPIAAAVGRLHASGWRGAALRPCLLHVGVLGDIMDDSTFDRLARRLEALASRRTALGALSGAGLVAALAGSRLDASAKRKKKKKKCKPESNSATCSGRCGSVKNNCKKSVECGSCPDCARCVSELCEGDPGKEGTPCGQTGQICDANGTCACNASSCGLGKGCFNGVCEECGDTDEQCCPGNSCDGGKVCLSGTCELCGFVGGPCCSSNNCVPSFGSGCFDGTCELCGAAGEQCCPGGICNFGNLFCTGGACQS